MADEPAFPAAIYVLAGTNGAGKSSIAGATFREYGAEYFNPDEVTRSIRVANPGIRIEKANSYAWHEGKRLLERAIAEQLDFAFETTLGGKTIPSLLAAAVDAGLEVRIWYVGLESPELHIARVRARVARGGHNIPETKIRERYNRSQLNLIRILPKLTELRLYDNSEERDPARGVAPRPRLLLHVADRELLEYCDLHAVPHWAKAIVIAALKHF